MIIPENSNIVIPDICFIVPGFVASQHVAPAVYAQTRGHLGNVASKSRTMARYGSEYTYQGRKLKIFPWPPILLEIQTQLALTLGVLFNAAVVNKYNTGVDELQPHDDIRAIPQLGKEPVIAGVVFGAKRPIQFIRKHDGDVTEVEVGHGDLYVMHGRSQLDYLHGIPRSSTQIPRLSITYRWHES